MSNIYDNPAYKYFKKKYYQVLEAVTKNSGVGVKINGFSLRMPAYYYRLFPSDYEKENFKFFKTVARKGMTCMDIGAHIGLYSVFMSKEGGGKVFGFEPTPSSRAVLQKMVALNNCENSITVVPAAVSDKSGKATFFIGNTPLSVANSLVDINFGEGELARTGYEVEVTSIDDYVSRNNLKLDFIKIDAEGVEVEVLKGGRNTFITQKPSGILGIHPFAYKDRVQTLTEIWQLLQDYKVNILSDGKEITKEEFLTKEEIFDLQFFPIAQGMIHD